MCGRSHRVSPQQVFFQPIKTPPQLYIYIGIVLYYECIKFSQKMQHICIAAIICTLFCGNLCAIFQDVFGDKSAFVVYNRFCRDGKTDFLRLDFYGLKRGIGMRVRGLQKLTLLDFPGKMGCTVFLGGCNFRCPFCQNSELILPGGDEYEIPEEEFLRFSKNVRACSTACA